MNGAHVNGKVHISSPVVESNGKFQEFWFNSSVIIPFGSSIFLL